MSKGYLVTLLNPLEKKISTKDTKKPHEVQQIHHQLVSSSDADPHQTWCPPTHLKKRTCWRDPDDCSPTNDSSGRWELSKNIGAEMPRWCTQTLYEPIFRHWRCRDLWPVNENGRVMSLLADFFLNNLDSRRKKLSFIVVEEKPTTIHYVLLLPNGLKVQCSDIHPTSKVMP